MVVSSRSRSRKASRAPQPMGGLTSLESLGRAAECLRTLAHPHRLRIVQLLLGGRYTVGQLAAACGIPSNMGSEHLRLMQRCGFLAVEKEGRNAYYTVAEPHLAAIMACIESRFGTGRRGRPVHGRFHVSRVPRRTAPW